MSKDDQVELIYQEYPRKVCKGAARKAIDKALRKVQFAVLIDAVSEYARACDATGIGREFIPYPATWFNQERWDDDRQEWWRTATGQPRESHEQARERANHEAIAGFLRSSVVREGNADADDSEAHGKPHGAAIESVARRVGHVQANND